MRTRVGFVSNSSSSSFILDSRDPRVKKILEDFRNLDRAEGLSRCTAKAVNEDAVRYAREWNTDIRSYDKPGQDSAEGGLGDWILYWAAKLGQENVVFLRESDEDMGGSFPYPLPAEVILEEREYH